MLNHKRQRPSLPSSRTSSGQTPSIEPRRTGRSRWQCAVARLISLALAGTIGLLIVSVPTASALPLMAEYSITWSQFTGPCYLTSFDQQLCPVGSLPGNDDIYLQPQAGAPYGIGPTQIGVVLQTPAKITWWKEIKA